MAQASIPEIPDEVNVLGDQDVDNLAGPVGDPAPDLLPSPTAALVRRHPTWWNASTLAEFGYDPDPHAGEAKSTKAKS